MLLSLIACKEEDPAVQENGALTADVSDDISDVSAESGINSDISDISSDTSDVSSESMESTDSIKNLALGKKYTLTGIYQDETGKEYWGDSEAYKLTDGMTGGKEDMAYVSPVWVGLNVNGKDTKKNNGKTTITVDLEKVEEEFQKATLYALEGKSAGIGAPKSVEVCFSEDKMVFTSAIKLEQKKIFSDENTDDKNSYAIYEYSADWSEGMRARYVRFEITHSLNWAFVSEVQVIRDLSKPTKSELYGNIEYDKYARYNGNGIMDQISLAYLRSNSLEGLYDIIRSYSTTEVAKNDKRSCVMYKGNGFNALVVFENGGTAIAIVEDYRNKTYTMYSFYSYGHLASPSHAYYSLNGPFLVGDYLTWPNSNADFRKKLDTSATSDKTLQRYNFLTTEAAFLDFADFYTGEKLDENKVFNYVYSPDHIMKNLRMAYVFDYSKQTNVGYDVLDNGLLKELLQFSFNQDLKAEKELGLAPSYSRGYPSPYTAYEISFDTYIDKNDAYAQYFDFEVGVFDDGTKFIRYLNRYAYLDNASYDKVCKICDTLWHKYTDNYGVINF